MALYSYLRWERNVNTVVQSGLCSAGPRVAARVAADTRDSIVLTESSLFKFSATSTVLEAIVTPSAIVTVNHSTLC